MIFDYYEELLQNLLGKEKYHKDKAFWLKVFNSAERRNITDTLEELIAETRYQMKTSKVDNPPAYLTSLIKKEIPLDDSALTRIEGNLVEHPFYRHGKHTNEPIKFTGTRYDEKTKTKINSEWVTSSESMIPNDEDADVFKTFLQLFHEQGMPESGEVNFTRYEICKRMQKPINGSSYKQIESALKYIFDTKITSKEAFLRFKDKIFLNTASDREYIRLIDTYKLRDSSDNVDGSKEMFSSRVVLGHYIVENMRLYYSTYLDWDFYTSLRFSISKRIYEYLQKKRGKEKKHRWKERLIPFAGRMGMSIKVTRNIKQNLKNPLEELKEKGYIFDFEISKERRDGEKEEFIVFNFTDTGKQMEIGEN